MQMWQGRIRRWHSHVFGDKAMQHGARIYAMRLLEEALELAQAEGVLPQEVDHIVEQVYRKPAGDPAKEFGGVLITATCYANHAELDMFKSFETEYVRINDPILIERVRYRNFHGDKIGLRTQDH